MDAEEGGRGEGGMGADEGRGETKEGGDRGDERSIMDQSP